MGIKDKFFHEMLKPMELLALVKMSVRLVLKGVAKDSVKNAISFAYCFTKSLLQKLKSIDFSID